MMHVTLICFSILFSVNISPAHAAASIVLDPSSGEVGSYFAISGSGFYSNSWIDISYDGEILGDSSPSSDPSGNFYWGIYVPASVAGPHTVSATDGYGNSASATFTVTPWITLSPSGGVIPCSTTVTGSGYAADSSITIEYNGVALAIGSILSDSFGSFAASFTVPASAAGSYAVLASDSENNSASATFTVGVPGYITILNAVQGGSTLAPPGSWNYTIVEEAGDGDNVVVDTFLLPAGGGGSHAFNASFYVWYIVIATPKYGYDMAIYGDAGIGYSQVFPVYISEGEAAPNEEEAYLDSGGWATITFTNSKAPSFAAAPLGSPPPGTMTYTPPPLTIVPIQAAWNPDKNNDDRFDLVSGKPMTVLVNLAGITSSITLKLTCTDVTPSSPALPSPVQVSYTPTGSTSSIAAFPSITLSAATTSPRDVILSVTTVSGAATSIPQITVTVRQTSDLSIYYGYLHKTAYPDPVLTTGGNYSKTVAQSNTFISAAYPVKAVTANTAQNQIKGGNNMLSDCMAIANAALKNRKAVGVAVTSSGYFANYAPSPDIVGVSYGPNVKGTIVAQNYWTAAAHEIGHTFDLYWETPEEYYQYPLYGLKASGVSAATGNWRSGQDFMGVAPYQTLDNTWVDTVDTYNPLFTKLTQTTGDPEIVVVSGIFHGDGSFETPFTWSKLQGTPSQILSGTYALKFVDSGGSTLALTKFDAKPIAQSSIGVTVGQDAPMSLLQGTGTIVSNDAGFCFATLLPDGTAQIQVLDTTQIPPGQPDGAVMGTVTASQILEAVPTNAYFTDADYNPIDSLECVFTPSTGSSYKMSATNPGTFCYNLKITNNNPTETFAADVNIPSDFVLKPLSAGADPVLINSQPVAYSFLGGLLSVPNIQISEGQTRTLTVRLDYKLKFQYGSPQPYSSSSQTTFARGYAFHATVDSFYADTGTIAAVGKKMTAIGGFLTDVEGVPKGGLTVVALSGASIVGTDTTTSDGFYFIMIASPGTYTVKITNTLTTPVGPVTGVSVAKNQFVQQDFNKLSPADPAITGFVKDNSDNPISAVAVQLLSRTGRVMATTSTNLGGYYVFRFSQPGQYTVKITMPAGYTATVASTTLTVKQFETDEVDFNLTVKT